jgi:plasmid stabilization system protein ParE
MQIKFTDKAIAHLENILDIFLEYAGERLAAKYSNLVDERINKISRYPHIGFIEPLLTGRKYLFRATVDSWKLQNDLLCRQRNYLDCSIFDMRMNPAKLKNMV